MEIWLADLTYTQQTIASDVVPAGIGMIAEYATSQIPDIENIRLFKYPEDLAMALQSGKPDIVGFSNYVWNSALSFAFAREVKKDFPETIIIFGGPNWPVDTGEQVAAIQEVPWVDYYISKEAEQPFVHLIKALSDADMKKSRLDDGLPNLAFIDPQDRPVVSARIERLFDVASIPSPYLSGRLDEFLDGRLLPVIQTARGCPFSCAFCTEGQLYWNKVRHKSAELIRDEIVYIAEHIAQLPSEKRRGDLLIADSNFGMFQQDINTCRVIGGVQDRFDYPRYINVATGKNKKERVLEAAKLVRGAMKLSGSVQSLDPVVQEKMKRNNISANQILEMAMQSAEVGANTYSEVILGLPGDSQEAHFSTLRTLVNAGFNTISMYQLMLLVGTEFGAEATKQAYDMEIKYRVIPRCFGSYEINGRKIDVAEIEEICVANNTLPFEDYLQCRKMNLIVNVFYNDGVFSEVVSFLTRLGLSPWEWMERIFAKDSDPGFMELISLFLDETVNELWDSRDSLLHFIREPGVTDRFIEGEFGSNLIFKYKALSLTKYFPTTCRIAVETLGELIRENLPERDHDEVLAAAEDIIIFKQTQLEGLFEGGDDSREVEFRFDVAALARAEDLSDLHRLKYPKPCKIRFRHTPEQREIIESYIQIFGNDVRGLSRILSRVYLKQLFRNPSSLYSEREQNA